MLKHVDRAGALETAEPPQHQVEPSGVRTHQKDPRDGEHGDRYEQRKQDDCEPDFAAGKIRPLGQPCEGERHREGERDGPAHEYQRVRKNLRVKRAFRIDRAEILQRPSCAGLERQVVRRPAESREQQHAKRYQNEIDGKACAEQQHQPRTKIQIVCFLHQSLV